MEFWVSKSESGFTSLLAFSPVSEEQARLHALLFANMEVITIDSAHSQVSTLVYALVKLDLGPENYAGSVAIHILGADSVELPSIGEADLVGKWKPLFDEFLSRGTTTHLRMLFCGPNLRKFQGVAVDMDYQGLHVQLEAQSGCYHDLPEKESPLLIVAYNAGLWGYESWRPTLAALFGSWLCSAAGAAGASAARSFLLITSYTHDESEDDYDTMFEVFSGLQQQQQQQQQQRQLQWHWDCEVNPQGATEDLERKGAPGANVYRENQCWQCISLK